VKNIGDMGIVYNLKKKFTAPSNRKNFVKKYDPDVVSDTEVTEVPKKHVAESLEKDANELRESNFRLPKCQVKELSYFIDKYGLNYKQMVRDHKNYYQQTWRQFRQKIRKFMSIPEQFSKYLEERNLIEGELDESKWKEATSDDE
jgi:Ribosome biogenesis protein Nop16